MELTQVSEKSVFIYDALRYNIPEDGYDACIFFFLILKFLYEVMNYNLSGVSVTVIYVQKKWTPKPSEICIAKKLCLFYI